MRRVKVLDLYAADGGISMGWYRAGCDVIGVDIQYRPDYPFTMVQADALVFLDSARLDVFDIIVASPPCQAHSWAARRWMNSGDREYPDLVEPTRQRLQAIGKPYVIENVVGAPLINPVKLTGPMFGLGVIRPRLFESNVPIATPHEPPPRGSVRTGEYVTVAGHGGDGGAKYADWCDAMGIHWLRSGSISDRKARLAQMIPPAYAEYIARRVREYLEAHDWQVPRAPVQQLPLLECAA